MKKPYRVVGKAQSREHPRIETEVTGLEAPTNSSEQTLDDVIGRPVERKPSSAVGPRTRSHPEAPGSRKKGR